MYGYASFLLADFPFAMDFDITSHADQIVTVEIGEALDFRNASEFKALCKDRVSQGARHFVLDFSDTGILDSTGLGAIFSLYRKVSPDDGQVVFASISRPVQVVVQLTRTYKVFRQFPSVAEAREALREENDLSEGDLSASPEGETPGRDAPGGAST